ncbi:hypothetical protein BB561_006437 [Smittium simulii]|uniref:DNA polymerase alpha/delta/epsilon subunit B domain-containing protein n=1 Tax=Smittium simulii TaxID=133385 RepID=A0A2T9Y4C3_9FUNG|nr:hypothetical protein BB561_006437 [Smittium simulii]
MVSIATLRSRKEVDLEISFKKFEPSLETFVQQYSGIYRKRLQTLWPVLLSKIEQKWNPNIGTALQPQNLTILSKIGDVSEKNDLAIIGTLSLSQKGKPSILEEISKSLWEKESSFPKNFWSENDELWLEDESGRILLELSNMKTAPVLVNGMVVAFYGDVLSNGTFVVKEFLDPGLAKQKEVQNHSIDQESDKYIAIISGLGLNQTESITKPMQMFAEFLSGVLGSDTASSLASSISCLVVAGNSIDINDTSSDFVLEKAKQYGLANTNDSVISSVINDEKDAFNNLDNYFVELAKLLPVLVMPGDLDPVSVLMPQKKIPANILLPNSLKYSSFYPLTNPSWFSIDEIKKSTKNKSALEVSISTLTGRHICPTSPDTLPCYPSLNHDPFILYEAPHVYFIGNQESFDITTYTDENGCKVTIVLVPKFKTTGDVVLINTSNFEAKIINFEL